MTFLAGNSGKATINGNEIPITAWNVNPTVRIATTDNSMSGGFVLASSTGSGKQVTFTINLDYDFDANPFATPYNLVIGAALTNVKLYLNGTSGPFWSFPSAIVNATPQGINHTGTNVVNVQVNCMSNGTFSYPGGITP